MLKTLENNAFSRVLSIYTEGSYLGKKKVCEQSSQTNQHLLTPKKLYHEYKTLYVEDDFFYSYGTKVKAIVRIVKYFYQFFFLEYNIILYQSIKI